MKNEQTILIVDDVSENVDVLVELLKEYDLVTALNGKSALEIVNDEDIDLILLDIMMPEMDGFEVCDILKKDSLTRHIPIIFLTAKDKSEDIQIGFNKGAVDYITKPFNPNELLSRVDTHLRLRAYEKNLEAQVQKELQKNKMREQMIHQQSKQAALGELLMHITHQWKQPLASLSSMNLLHSTKLEREIPITKEEELEEIKKSDTLIQFMADTVDTFKDFYEPSTAKEDFSLTDSVNRVLAISHATLRHENVKITLYSSEKEGTYGNSNELTQIIFSIINNARDIFKHRSIQNPELSIRVEDKKITICDNAGGVDETIIDDIFLPNRSTTGGNGIGLYIAKEIIEKNGGIIYVANETKGAKFTVEFLTWLS